MRVHCLRNSKDLFRLQEFILKLSLILKRQLLLSFPSRISYRNPLDMTAASRPANFVLVASCRAASGNDRRCPSAQTFLVIPRVFATSTSIRGGEAAAHPSSARSDENRGVAKTCRVKRIACGAAETQRGERERESHLFFTSLLIDIDRSLLRRRRLLRPVRACLLRFFLPMPGHYRTCARRFLSRYDTAAGTGYRVTLQKGNRRVLRE